MTKLVLINSPIQKYSDSYRPKYRTTAPLGLGYLGTIARNAGIETVLIDAEAEKLTLPELTQKVNALNPQTVGINMTSTNYKISLEILDGIDSPHKMVGGAHATLKGEDIARERPDLLVVKGEADDAFVDLVRNQRKGLVTTGLVNNLDNLPFIDRTLFSNDPYVNGDRKESAMVTARGCPFSCVFCSVPVTNGRKVRTRSMNNVMAEIEQLQTQGIDTIHFMDDIFNYDKTRLSEFCDSVNQRGLNLGWRALARVELLNDRELIEKMASAGCYKLAFDIESGVPKILDYIGKCNDLDLIKSVFRNCREAGIETKAFFTIGHPPETEADIRRTIDFSQEIKATEAYFMVVRAFPGTRLYDEMRKTGITEKELDNYKQYQDEDGYVKYHVMNFRSLNGMSNDHLDTMVKEAYGRFYKKPECCTI